VDKEQLRDMRAILSSEANGAPFPKIAKSSLAAFEQRKWIENVGGVYKSTQLGRQAVLAAGKGR
jgi:hypothetical protein